MTTKAASPCQSVTTTEGLERTRYFGHQLVGPDDLTRDQDYFREKSRRHNRMLHGWGVVCGACVGRGATSSEIVIEPGYILGPYGDEIAIESAYTLDLSALGTDEECGCCGGGSADPWCADGAVPCPPGVRYLAVRYDECLSHPVRKLAGACGGGCDDECEYSRISDGYVVSLLSELPAGYTTPMRPPQKQLPCFNGVTRPCPPCPESPWVVLADVMVAEDCTVRGIDCFAHRRYAVTFATQYQICADAKHVKIPGTDSGVGVAWPTYGFADPSHREIMDLTAGDTADQPAATVSIMRRNGRPASLPGYFKVRAGDTLGDVLDREGGRLYFDPATGVEFTLGDLAAAARVDRTRQVNGIGSVLAELEHLTVDFSALRAARETVEEVLTLEARARLTRDHDGSWAGISALTATGLMGIGDASDVGKQMAKMTISEVAGMEKDAFVEKMLGGIPDAGKAAGRKKALEGWEAARKVLDATREASKR